VGKRQYRVAQKDIVSKAAELQGQKVQVILENNRVFSGLVQEVSVTEVVLKDARFNIHRLSPDDVREVVYDKETLY
jgi:small nuclear ribonucleoprotein (snRNP)-like protein